MTDCSQTRFEFKLEVPVVSVFNAPTTSSDGGLLLLAKLDDRLGLCAAAAACLTDSRDPNRVDHSRFEQVRQRVLMIAMGYEDCNDATTLRKDALLKTVCEREPEGAGLSSQPTLSRLEHSVEGRSVRGIRTYLERSFVQGLPPDTGIVVLDIDTTCDPTHGQQQLSFFNAHYDTHMYHPLMVFDGLTGKLVSVMLQPGNAGAARCAPAILGGILRRIKQRFPQAQIVLRGDAAFSTPELLEKLDTWNEQFGEVYYLLGFAKNSKLVRLAADSLSMAQDCFQTNRTNTQLFQDLRYRCGSWKQDRLMVVKAEHGPLGSNPRFLVTNIEGFPPRLLYQAYCERGQCENYIKDFKNALAADRLSCTRFLPNYFRLLLHALAYNLMFALRQQVAEQQPELSSWQFDTLRLKLLKVSANVKRTCRRIVVQLSEAFPLSALFNAVAHRILSLIPAGA